MKKISLKRLALNLTIALVFSGCSSLTVKEFVKPSLEKDQFTKITRVAVFPFDNFTDAKDAEKAIEAMLIPDLYDEEVFQDVIDPRFVRDAMKKLKITSTDILDREQVKKLGDELGIQGVIVGKIVSYGKGKDPDAGNIVSLEMALVDISNASILWTGNVTAEGGLTFGKVFGVTGGLSDVDVVRKAIHNIVEDMADSINDAREDEREGIVAELREKELAEEKRLRELQKEREGVEEKLQQADAEAERIRQEAITEAEEMKAEVEMEKATIEAEKSQIEAEKEALELEKLELESERAKIDEEMSKLDEVKGEISDLDKEKGELEEEIQKLREEISEESVGDQEKQIDKLEELEKEQEKVQQEIDSRKDELETLEQQIEDVEKKD